MKGAEYVTDLVEVRGDIEDSQIKGQRSIKRENVYESKGRSRGPVLRKWQEIGMSLMSSYGVRRSRRTMVKSV